MSTETISPLLTVVIIAADDGSHEAEYVAMEQDIRKQEYNPLTRYFIYKYDTKSEIAISKQLQANTYGLSIFKPKTELKGCNGGFFKPGVLTEFLNRVKEEPVAEQHRYILITWGHGSGLGFFSRIDDTVEPFLPENWQKEGIGYYKYKINRGLNTISFFKANLLRETGNEKTDRLIDALWNDINKGKNPDPDKIVHFRKYIYDHYKSGITAKMLSDTIDDSIKRANILICMNCFSQMVETCHAFLGTVGVIIGGQKVIPFNGFNYQQLFQLLNANPIVSEEDIAQNITHYFPIKYLTDQYFFSDSDGNFKQFSIFDSHIGAINIERYALAYSAIERIITNILNLKTPSGDFQKVLSGILRPSRSLCGDLTGKEVGIIDITAFFEHVLVYLKTRSPIVFNELFKLYRIFYNARQGAVLSAFFPQKASLPIGSSFDFIYHTPKHTSVVFPYLNNSDVAIELREQYLSDADMQEFFHKTKWDIFIRNFFK